MTVYSDVCASEAKHSHLRADIARGELSFTAHGLNGAAVVGLVIPDTPDSDTVAISRTGAQVTVNETKLTIKSPITALVVKLLGEGHPIIRNRNGRTTVIDARDVADEYL